jgi:hypothetical protein
VRTDHYIGIVRRERDGWSAHHGVGSTLQTVSPPLPRCPKCGVVHTSRREVQRLHGTQARRSLPSACYPTAADAIRALVDVLAPLYARAQDRARIDGDPVPPLLIAVGDGNAWDVLDDALAALDEIHPAEVDAEEESGAN